MTEWLDWPGRPDVGTPMLLAHYLDPGDASPIAAAGYAEMQAVVSAAAAWGTANRAWYLPVYVSTPTQIAAMAWRNGTVVNGNVDVGLYTRTGVRLASSGAVAQAGANVGQSVALSVVLTPELYYLAMSSSSATATFWRWTYGTPGALYAQACGFRREEGAHPLPAVATPVAPSTDYIPLLAASGRTLL